MAAAEEAHAESHLPEELPHSHRLLRWGTSTVADLAAAEAAHGSAHLADTDLASGKGREDDELLTGVVGQGRHSGSEEEDYAAERPLTRAMR